MRKLIVIIALLLSACAKNTGSPATPGGSPTPPQSCVSLQTDLIASGQAYDYVHGVNIAPVITEISLQNGLITTTVNSNVPAGSVPTASFTLTDSGNELVSSADGIAIVVETTDPGTTCSQLMVEETVTDWSVTPAVSYHVTQLYIPKP